MALGFCAPARAAGEANYFNDPFLQVTSAIADCPPRHPMAFSPAELQGEAHSRAERGTRCYQSGQCRLPSSYDYDKEIIPRVAKAIVTDGRFADTSVWAEGQRRWVWLKGCVRTQAQAAALTKLVRSIDDVERVIDMLVVKKR
jgi:osmotically-inducible protein OsmY